MSGQNPFMVYFGMMPGELLKCTVSMVDLEACMIVGSGLKTKTRKAAPIVFPQLLTPIVQSMIENAGPNGQLINRAKQGFYGDYDYKEDLDACGIRYHKPYACRNTTATALALGNEVAAPSVIQRIMRHANFSTTERYITDAQKGVNTLLKPVSGPATV
ncbi:MAG: site-specific integrase [Clostridia bacterium]|nr:site-specific integrase [Clostridia bacterium]